jgi:hypothetical protein
LPVGRESVQTVRSMIPVCLGNESFLRRKVSSL